MSRRRSDLVVLAGWLALAAVVLSVAAPRAGLPGLYYDESIFVGAAYPQPGRGGLAFVEWFGEPTALLIMSYLGSLKGWLYRPLLDVFGGSAATARVPVLLLGVATLAWRDEQAGRASTPMTSPSRRRIHVSGRAPRSRTNA